MPPKTLKKSTIVLLFLATLGALLFFIRITIDYENSLERIYALPDPQTAEDTANAEWKQPVIVYRVLATAIAILLLLIGLGFVCFNKKYWRLYTKAEDEITNLCGEVESLQKKQEPSQVYSSTAGHSPAYRTDRQVQQFSNEATTNLLTNIAHRIFSPMNSIVEFTAALRRSSLSDKQQEPLNALISASGHLLDIIEETLNYARIKIGRIELKPSDFNLREMITDVLKDVSPKIAGKPITLKHDIHSSVSDFIRTDPDRLCQILVFLLNSAIKFTNEGEITVSVRQDNPASKKKGLCFVVRNTGPGIPLEYKPAVFKVFLQSDRAIIRKFGNTALGLMLSKEYVTLMGGEIKVESQPGKGSEFLFTIPYQESQTPPGDKGSQTAFHERHLG